MIRANKYIYRISCALMGVVLFNSHAAADSIEELRFEVLNQSTGVKSEIQLYRQNTWLPIAVTDDFGKHKIKIKCNIGERFRAKPYEVNKYSFSKEEFCQPGKIRFTLFVLKLQGYYFNGASAGLREINSQVNSEKYVVWSKALDLATKEGDYGKIAHAANEIVVLGKKYEIKGTDQYAELAFRATAAAIGSDIKQSVTTTKSGKPLVSPVLASEIKKFEKAAGIHGKKFGTIGIKTLQEISGSTSWEIYKQTKVQMGLPK